MSKPIEVAGGVGGGVDAEVTPIVLTSITTAKTTAADDFVKNARTCYKCTEEICRDTTESIYKLAECPDYSANFPEVIAPHFLYVYSRSAIVAVLHRVGS